MGKYKKRLYKTLFILSITLVSIMSLIVSLNFFTRQKNQFINTIQQTSVTKANNSDFAINVITKNLSEFTRTPELKEWVTTKNSSTYYYNSLRIYTNLKKLSTNLSLIDYDMAVTILDDSSSVISQVGTFTKDIYFETETSLTSDQVDYIFHYFKYNSAPLTLPSYKDDKLDSIYYMVKQSYDDSAMLFLVKIPYKTLFGKDYDQSFMIHDGHKVIGVNNINDSQEELTEYLVSNLEQVDNITTPYYLQDLIVFSYSLNETGWKIAYVYENISLDFTKILIYFIIPLLFLITLALLISKLITEILYKPIKEIILELQPEATDNKILDEFELLKQNTSKLSILSTQLQNTLKENDLLVSQKFYRGLLLGNDVDPILHKQFKTNDKDYCAAIIEFQYRNDTFTNDEIFFYKNNISSKSLEYKNLQYINISHDQCAMIVQTNTLDDAKYRISEVIDTVNEFINIKVSISDIRYGIDNINTCFNEALKILEYKHLYVNNEIITMNEVSDLVDSTYYYPLLTENRLIQNIIEGNQEAIEIFDNLIRENIQHRNLGSYTLKNFIFVLIGTLNRVFQELKTTPEEFLDENIDFEKLYNSWNNVNIINQMKQVITSILEKVNTQNENIDDTLLNDMRQYIFENYSDDIMLNDMASEFNISPKYCSALFKRLSDDNFRNFLNKYRVDKAKEFLEADPELKISDLSTMVGFNSSSNFIRVFGKYVGLTPKAFADQIISLNNK